MFSLASPHLGDSNEYTQYTIQIKKKKYPKYNYVYFCKGLKRELEIAVVCLRHNRDISLSFVCCAFSLASPHLGD